MRVIREGFLKGVGFCLALLVFTALSALVAQTFRTFKSGDVISASYINDTFQFLKTRVESPLPVVESAAVSVQTGSTTFTDATGLTVTVTSTGSPIWIGLNSAGGLSGGLEADSISSDIVQGHYRLVRDSTPIAQFPLFLRPGTATGSYNVIPSSAIWYIDNPGAGTYTYKLQFRVTGLHGSNVVRVNNSKLIAARFNEL